MELNNNQLEYLRGRAALIIEDPIQEMTEMWLVWANENVDLIYSKDSPCVKTEEVLPVIWVFSQLYDCPPKVIFTLMKRALKKRLSVLGFEQLELLDFEDANTALGEVLKELQPIGKSHAQQELSPVK